MLQLNQLNFVEKAEFGEFVPSNDPVAHLTRNLLLSLGVYGNEGHARRF